MGHMRSALGPHPGAARSLYATEWIMAHCACAIAFTGTALHFAVSRSHP